MHGNVWVWVQDCRNARYVGAPTDGSPWIAGECGLRVLRGGSWVDFPWFLRAASRDSNVSAHGNGYGVGTRTWRAALTQAS